MKDVKEILNMRDLTLEVQNKIIDKVESKINEINKTELSIVDEYFVISPTADSYSNSFYLKIDRSNYEILEIRTQKKYSLNVLIQSLNLITDILKEYEEAFNKLFGIALKTVDDFINNCEFLIDSAIDKRYLIGKLVSRGYDNYGDEYGIIFDPSSFFSIEFTDEDKKYYGKSHMRCYVEFDKDTINSKDLAEFLIKIVEKNRITIEKYIEEGKNDKKD